ncbi:hypothetical protein [Serratia grimesii]|uniref:hypothetical protein n=1 Tax=Serratia grimesii TaxID=82995 RepID=UPI00217AD4A6|nr:hypothetical protein [Serratia grimesii]CAI0896872.1 Uncharacterised protein [Serratia grimesii]
MTHIQQLTNQVLSQIPFNSSSEAQGFLQPYTQDDQAALISALYIGRDHIHFNTIQEDYIPDSIPFDRYFHTGGGHGVRWLINPAEFKDILYEKSMSLKTYYGAFLRCTNGSGLDLSRF